MTAPRNSEPAAMIVFPSPITTVALGPIRETVFNDLLMDVEFAWGGLWPCLDRL
jgi:hypothetical protein